MLLIEKIKKHMKDIVNISVHYTNYNFISNYKNCLLVSIEKDKQNKNCLIFLTECGTTKSVDIEDLPYINVKVNPICQKQMKNL